MQNKKQKIVNLIGIIILLLLAISIYKARIYVDTSNYKKFLGNMTGLFVAWYGVALLLYGIVAGNSKVTETEKFKINDESFSVTRETGEIISGNEEGGKMLFKVWWLLSPIYFMFLENIKSLFSLNITTHKNLDLILKLILIVGSFLVFFYSIKFLNREKLPRKIFEYLMYGFLVLFGIFLIIGVILWAMK